MATTDSSAALPRRGVFGVGVFMFVVGVVGLVVGWILIQSLARDLSATMSVSRSAVQTIGDTVELGADLAEGTTEAMSSAAEAAKSAADATREAAVGIATVSAFLEEDLPDDIEAIHMSLPGAIQAADAIDSTLRALSLLGLDYSPDEPFGDSLRRIQATLDDLPAEVRAQSQALDLLTPTVVDVADNVDALADDLARLQSTLTEIDEVAASYTDTVVEAETVVAETGSSLDRTVLILRIMLVLSALGATSLGYALVAIDRRLTIAESPVLLVEPVDVS